MYKHRIRFLFALLCLIAFCSAAQATKLQITVQDSLDNTRSSCNGIPERGQCRHDQ